MLGCAGIPSSIARELLTPEDAVQTARFLDPDADADTYVSHSPDSRRYVLRLLRGDVNRNGIWLEVLTGSLNGPHAGEPPVVVARLFSTGRGVPTNGGPDADGSGRASPIRWIDNTRIAFLFSNAAEIRQVVEIDLTNRRTTFLTDHASHVRAFDVSPTGDLVYLAQAQKPSSRQLSPRTTGYVVPAGADAVSIAEGYFDGESTFSRSWDSEWFVKRRGRLPERVTIGNAAVDPGYPDQRDIVLSHDGKQALILGPAATVPVQWERYKEEGTEEGRALTRIAEQTRASPGSVAARDAQQLYVLDIARRSARPLWNAPGPRIKFLSRWSPTDQWIALANVPTPIPSDSVIPVSASVVLIAPQTSTYQTLPIDGNDVTAITWVTDSVVRFTVREGELTRDRQFARSGTEWIAHDVASRGSQSKHDAMPGVVVRQTLTEPPRLFLIDARSGKQTLLLDPNPDLVSRFTLGDVRRLEGKLSSGERWSALLTTPPGYDTKRPLPLVIQSQYHVPIADKFTLYGWAYDGGLGPATVAAYAAQGLAARGIAVLQLNVDDGEAIGSPQEVEVYQRAFEELAEQLSASGVADRARIGLSGFSRNGYFVSYTLSHSRFPFAAAVVIDNFDPSYVQTTLTDSYPFAEPAIGASAFGDGLQRWLDRAPGFNAERIRAPLRLVGQSKGVREYVLWEWELFGRLRYLQRPVELYVMPEADAHPSHTPQNPQQILAVQKGTIDWFDFWLNERLPASREDPQRAERWAELRIKQQLLPAALADHAGGPPTDHCCDRR